MLGFLGDELVEQLKVFEHAHQGSGGRSGV